MAGRKVLLDGTCASHFDLQQLAALSCVSRRCRDLYSAFALRKRCLRRGGVPSSHRLAHYRRSLKVGEVCARGGVDAREPARYHDSCMWGIAYAGLAESSKVGGVEGEIFRDVGRTFPRRPLFVASFGEEGAAATGEAGGGGASAASAPGGADSAGDRALARVLKAISKHHGDVGYCQGMNYVAADLLELHVAAAGDQREGVSQSSEIGAFSMMHSLLTTLELHLHWQRALPRMQLRIFQFECLVTKYIPGLCSHLRDIGLGLDYFVSQWFLTLFASVLDLGVTAALWDVIFVDGWKAMHRIALAMIATLAPSLLVMDLEHASMYCKRLRPSAFGTARDILTAAAAFKVTTGSLETMQSQYFLKVLQHYLDGKDWQSFTPLNLQRRLKQKDDPATARLDAMRSEIKEMDGFTLGDVAVLRAKIEHAERAVATARASFRQAEPAFLQRKIQFDDHLARKAALQQLLHELLADYDSRSSGASNPPAHVMEDDVCVFKTKIVQIDREISRVRAKFIAARNVFLPAQLELEESDEGRRALHSQLSQLIAQTEKQKVDWMAEWISCQQLESNFGEDSTREQGQGEVYTL